MRNSIALVAVVSVLGGATACSSESTTNIYEVADAASAVDARTSVGDPLPDADADTSDPRDAALDAGSDPVDATGDAWWGANCPAWAFQDAATPDADFITSTECVVIGACNDVCAPTLYACPGTSSGVPIVQPADHECLTNTATASNSLPIVTMQDDAGRTTFWTTSCCYGADE